MNANPKQHRTILENIAYRAMLSRGLLPDFSVAVLEELSQIHAPATPQAGSVLDMRDMLWCSIDNDDSLDLDQLTAAEALPGGSVKIRVSIADVDSLVRKGSAIDEHGRHNTTSVYTAAVVFPMLPEKLSTNFTSLNFDGDRLSNVVEMVFDKDGALLEGKIHRAVVCNHAKLAYNSVAAWLEGQGPVPEPVAAVAGLEANLRLQDQVAQKIKKLRHLHGALSLETIEARPVFDGEMMTGLEVDAKNRAKEIIEDFMIAANGVTARYLTAQHFPTIRRVVRTPKRWDRIVEIAEEYGYKLPGSPDARALEAFLTEQQAADPLRFPDLSLSIIKLLGAGEYIADRPDDPPPGHFGLAVRDYMHSTAPNRRYPDLVTQRLVKAALAGEDCPYRLNELEFLANHFTTKEDDAKKVERRVAKSAAALLLENRIGETFDAIVTGASPKGTWVRLLSIPVEGKLIHGFEGVDVHHRLHVQLVSVDVEQGYIDFRKVNRSKH
jgi:ribonuclease R